MAARVHHLNCGTMCPHGGAWMGGTGGPWKRGRMVCHCLLVESRDGLVLVDTGLGTADVAQPTARLGALFPRVVGACLDPAETAHAQVRALGFDAADVRHLVVTHLDLDHAGGLSDFPEAQVHVHAREHAAATQPTWREQGRYRAPQLAHGPRWALHSEQGERWEGFDAVRALPGVDDDILLVPLHGHSRGHCGVAVNTSEGWLLHAGDAYFHHTELTDPSACPPGLATFQRLVQIDGPARLANQQRLRELARTRGDAVSVFSAHDPVELDRFAATP